MKSEQVTQEIRNFIVENFFFGDTTNPLNEEDSFLENGIIDSTGVLELVAFLEQRFQFEVADDELIPENLDSIVNVINYLQKKVKREANSSS